MNSTPVKTKRPKKNPDNRYLFVRLTMSEEDDDKLRGYLKHSGLQIGKFVKAAILNEVDRRLEMERMFERRTSFNPDSGIENQ